MIGSILFNGNALREQDFIHQFKDRILKSNHVDSEVQAKKKVLLITGAWKENEFQEQHVKKALRDIGIPVNYQNGFDDNIQNLCVYHELLNYYKQNPYVHDVYMQTMMTLEKVRQLYQERSIELFRLMQKHTKMLKHEFPKTPLSDILSSASSDHQWQISQLDSSELLKQYACQEVRKTLGYLVGGDELQAKISAELQEYAKGKSGIFGDPVYQNTRQKLVERILSCSSIFIFGGDIDSLYHSLQFWQLQGALAEALLRGTNFYTISAGSMVLAQKIIVFDNFVDKEGNNNQHFEFFDNGFGLVTKITLLPHCQERIQTDDPDNLAYLAHRFEGRVCVGLNEGSYLLLDAHRDENGRLYPRYTSVGTEDGVYVFNRAGEKIRLDYGEQVLVPGTLVWEKRYSGTPLTPTPSFQPKGFVYKGQTLWAADK